MYNSHAQPHNLILILKMIQYFFYKNEKKKILGTKFAIYAFLIY